MIDDLEFTKFTVEQGLFHHNGIRVTHKPTGITISVSEHIPENKNYQEAVGRMQFILQSRLELTDKDEKFILDNAMPTNDGKFYLQFFERTSLYFRFKALFNSVWNNQENLKDNDQKILLSFRVGNITCLMTEFEAGSDKFVFEPKSIGCDFKNFDCLNGGDCGITIAHKVTKNFDCFNGGITTAHKVTIKPEKDKIKTPNKRHFEIVNQFTVYGRGENQVEVIVIDAVFNREEMRDFNNDMNRLLETPTITVNINQDM